MKSCGVPLCGTDSGRAVLGKPAGRAVSLDFAGGGANLGQRKSLEHNPAPGLCLWQERSVSIANCMVSQKGRRRVWGNRRFLPHMERSGSPRRSGRHLAMPNALAPKEKGTFRCPFSFGAEDGTRTHTPKYWLLRPERLPFRHFRLFHFGLAHSQNSRPTSTRIIPFLALACQFPGLSPPFGGCLSTGVVLG